jgi:hypothetical protein
MKAFRESPFCERARPGPGALLTVAVRSVEAPPRGQALAVARVAGQHGEVAARAGVEVRFAEDAGVGCA